MNPKNFQASVLKWFDIHGRKNLPWQIDKSPYRVWISEIMLQQTQVGTVVPYFERFMMRFPTLSILATAEEDDVLHLWTGLGYYSRARNLLKTAKLLGCDNLPSTIADLQALPGIGRSTAGAILAIAFNQRAAILDGNVKRVLVRFHAIAEWPGNVLKELWDLAETYTPAKRTADYTQAMMDLGATICKRGKPLCNQCPLQANCKAFALGLQNKLPIPKLSNKLPTRSVHLLIIRHANTVLLRKRSPVGVWASLWSLPEFANLEKLEAYCEQHFNKYVTEIQSLPAFRHTFSHFHLNIYPVEILIKGKPASVMEAHTQIWYNLTQPAAIGLPAPIKSLLEKLV